MHACNVWSANGGLLPAGLCFVLAASIYREDAACGCLSKGRLALEGLGVGSGFWLCDLEHLPVAGCCAPGLHHCCWCCVTLPRRAGWVLMCDEHVRSVPRHWLAAGVRHHCNISCHVPVSTVGNAGQRHRISVIGRHVCLSCRGCAPAGPILAFWRVPAWR